jgi:anti-sigma factor RsiW
MSFDCSDKDALVSYIYDECDAAARGDVESHLAACPACADEVKGLGIVRSALSQWAPPERVGGFRLVRDDDAPAPANVLRPARWWQPVLPTLVRAAAAILLVAGGAALANLEVRYDKDGFAIRTGWGKSPAPAPVSAAARPTPPAASAQPAAFSAPPRDMALPDPAPWRTEMAAFERQVEVRLQAAAAKASAPAPVQVAGSAPIDESHLMQRVYAALEESERRQQVDAALRMSRLVSDLQAGRAIDVRRIGLDALPPAAPSAKPKSPNWFDVSPVSLPVKK